jgi:hypothetical protein
MKQLFGGSSSKSTQQSGIDPRFFEMFNNNFTRATGVAENLGARQFADFTPDYQAGATAVRNAVSGPGLNTVGSGVKMAQAAGNYDPLNVKAQQITGQGYNAATANAATMNRGDVRDVSGGSFLNMNLDAYMNPFLQNVAGNTMADMDRARQITQMDNANAAARAGAFGGSRQGVLEAETNRGYFDRLGNTLGNLYATGFDAASNLAGQDLNRRLEASLANQGVDYNVANTNTANRQAVNLANMGALNEAGAFGATATNAANLANQAAALEAARSNQAAGLTANQQQLAASSLLGELGLTQQEMGLQGGEALINLGLAEQGFNQQQLDAIRNLPLEQQAIINEALGINPGGGSGMRSSGSSSSESFNGIFNSLFPKGI